MSTFTARWDRPEAAGIGQSIRNAFRPPAPLRPRLEEATRVLRHHMSKLDEYAGKLLRRDAEIFTRVVSAVRRADHAKATIFANELVEIRRIARMVTQGRLAFEQIAMRIETITDLGDIVTTLGPATGVIRNIKSQVAAVTPIFQGSMDELGAMLSSLLVDAGQMGGYEVNFESANEDAERILTEAAALAEQRIRERLPEIPERLPTSTPASEYA